MLAEVTSEGQVESAGHQVEWLTDLRLEPFLVSLDLLAPLFVGPSQFGREQRDQRACHAHLRSGVAGRGGRRGRRGAVARLFCQMASGHDP